jgi:hypothetical protein
MRNEYIILWVQVRGKYHLETLSVDGSKMNLNKIGHEDVDRINLAQDGDPISGCCEHGNERSESKQDKSFLTS